MTNKTVFILQNGKKLTKMKFCSYFEKKVFACIKNYNLIKSKDKILTKSKLLFHILKKFTDRYGLNAPVLNGKHNKIATDLCLDDSAESIITFLITNKPNSLKDIKPNYKKEIYPFFFCSLKEIELYAKIKKIKLKKKKKTDISLWLDELESKQKNVKNAIVNSLKKLDI